MNVQNLISKILEFVNEAERFDDLSGAEKRAYVINKVVSWVKLPFWMPKWVFVKLLEIAIDLVVAGFNELDGKEWGLR